MVFACAADWGTLGKRQTDDGAGTLFAADIAAFLSRRAEPYPVWVESALRSSLALQLGSDFARVRSPIPETRLKNIEGFVVYSGSTDDRELMVLPGNIREAPGTLVAAYRSDRAYASVMLAKEGLRKSTPTFAETKSSSVRLAETIIGAGRPEYVCYLQPVLFRRCRLRNFFDSGTGGEGLRLGGNDFSYGLKMRSNTSVTYRIAGKYKGFEAWVGLDDDETRTTKIVYFTVHGDRTLLAGSPWLRGGDPPWKLWADLAGVHELRLTVVNRGDVFQTSHASWGNALVY